MYVIEKNDGTCNVRLEFPEQTPARVREQLGLLLTELALQQAMKRGEYYGQEASEMSVPCFHPETNGTK